jgi:hypothetical protein
MKLPCFIFVLLVVAITGCVMSDVRKVPGVNYDKTDPKNVELLYQMPKRDFEVIGFVSMTAGAGVHQPRVEQEFRDQAAKLGADAVIIDALPAPGSINAVEGKGRAIRWKQ